MTETEHPAANDLKPVANDRSPLEPIASIIRVLGVLVAGFTVIAGVLALYGTSTGKVSGSFLGFGRSAVPAVSVPLNEVRSDIHVYEWRIRPQAFAQMTGYRIDIIHPDFAQRFWYTAANLPSLVVILGSLILAHLMIKRARRDGIYTAATARRIHVLGQFLIGGALVRMIVEEVANNRLLATMVTNHIGWVTSMYWHIPWTLLIFGGALLSVARVIHLGAGIPGTAALTPPDTAIG